MTTAMVEPFFLKDLQVWYHEANPQKPTVLIVHGLGEHSERHANTYGILLKNQYNILRFDFRGCGKSKGKRQAIGAFQDYVDDLNEVSAWYYEKYKAPLYLLGHSLGGAVATHYVVQKKPKLKGLLLSAPAFLTGNAVPAWKITVGKMLVNYLPDLKVPSLTQEAVSRDPEVVKNYKNDPLCSHYTRLFQGNEILNALEKMPELFQRIQVPTLMAHGLADRIIKPEGSEILFQKLNVPEKILHLLPEVYHEPHNDYGKEAYFDLLLKWLKHQG